MAGMCADVWGSIIWLFLTDTASEGVAFASRHVVVPQMYLFPTRLDPFEMALPETFQLLPVHLKLKRSF